MSGEATRDFAARFREGRDGRLGGYLGIELEVAERDRVVARLEVRPELVNNNGVVHGGVLMSFADELGGFATGINLPPGHFTTTIESKTNFVRGGRGRTLRGEATLLHKGRRTMVWVTHVRDDQGRLVSVTTQTQIVLEQKRRDDAPREEP